MITEEEKTELTRRVRQLLISSGKEPDNYSTKARVRDLYLTGFRSTNNYFYALDLYILRPAGFQVVFMWSMDKQTWEEEFALYALDVLRQHMTLDDLAGV